MKRIIWGIVPLAAILSCCKVEGRHDKQQIFDVGSIAFVHVNVVPMTSEIVTQDQTVLIEGDRIVAIGPVRSVSIPENVMIIEGEGAYLMPGLADMHIHTRQDWESENWPVSPLLLYLANGVTTIRDFGPSGDEPGYALRWRDEVAAGTRVGPSIYASGTILFASPLPDPQGIVHENHDLGFDFLKFYSYLSKEDFREAMMAAKDLNMYTAGHIPYAVGLESVLVEGMDEIAHVEELLFEFLDFDRDRKSVGAEAWLAYIVESALKQFDVRAGFDGAEPQDPNLETISKIVERLRLADAPVCTTMVVDDVIQQKLFHPKDFLTRPENQFLPPAYLERFRQGTEKHQMQFVGIENLAAYKYELGLWLLRRLNRGGISLLLGTDSGTGGMGIVPGFSIHDELRILVENGFSPYEAIATGTVNASKVAEKMIWEDDFGTIEVGKRADVLLLGADPLEDVEAIRDLRGVMAAGRWYSREILAQLIGAD